MKHKRKRPGKPAGMNYADVLKSRRDRLQLAMAEVRAPAETVRLVIPHYRRSFGVHPGAEVRGFIRNAAENGLTAAELVNCMTAVRLAYVFGASETACRKAFMAEARRVWKRKRDNRKASL